ncbi:hypothetical protein [Streptomyces scabiei]|uniref:hypothetical protein n=1 Tax=Streptomyces TaxID=1883 RepID=UPI0029AD9119|nr:hypothetical protein [Streptomyces scabiei]MDX3119447.1 hypothetical protein [Streptomyces scabiei]
MDTEAAVAVPDAASATDPPTLKLSSGPAPAGFDTGDHVNLTADGYRALGDAFDITALGPDT